MRRNEKHKTKSSTIKFIRNIIIVFISLSVALFILKTAPDYVKNDITDKTNLVINNNNITSGLKNDVILKNGVIYLSKSDIDNFFDPYIYYDETDKRVITTYGTKVAALILNNNNITVNGSNVTIQGSAIMEGDTLYLPFSSLNDVYNAEINYIEETDTITVDSLTRKQVQAQVSKNVSVKSQAKTLCRTVDKVKKSDTVIVVSVTDDGWAKVRTKNGKLGYIKEKYLANEVTVREEIVSTPQIAGKINMVWDYYSEYVTAPDRTGTTIDGVNVVSPTFFTVERLGEGRVLDKVGTSGKKYIEWAKANGYKVWAMVSNESRIETTSAIMNSYALRSTLIENIVNLAVKYELDGINIDFEYMYDKDIDLFTQFLVELHPRLKEYGMVLSVDVTAPDGGENWSLCYDRDAIADNCDYIVFMAYDQYGESSTKAGTTAGHDWVKVNLRKFINTEEIDPNKIILGIPFYTRLWQEGSTKVTSDVVDMKNVNKVLPANVDRKWLDNVKQYYAEYKKSGNTYKMWIEDERSIKEKLSLISEFELAGAAFWSKGRESDTIWSTIKENLQ